MQEISMQFSPKSEMQLSRETPVYDALHIKPFHLKIMKEMARNPQAHVAVFFLGPPVAGKEVLKKYFLWRQKNDSDIQKIVTSYEATAGQISYAHISTPDANWLGREEGGIVSQVGQFTCDEVAVSNLIVSAALANRYYEGKERGGPRMDLIEGGFFGYPYWGFTGPVLAEACERTREDPNYSVKAIVSIPTSQLQEYGMQTREIIDDIERAGSPAEAEIIRRRQLNDRGVIFDVSPAAGGNIYTGSWGTRRTVRQHRVFGNKHAIKEKERIRRLARGTRRKEMLRDYSFSEIQPESGRFDPDLWVRVHMARMQLILESEMGMNPGDFIIRKNSMLSETDIPFPRGYGNEVALISAPWNQVTSSDSFTNEYL